MKSIISLEGYQSSRGNIIRSHWIAHLLVEVASSHSSWWETQKSPMHMLQLLNPETAFVIFIYSSCIFYVLVCAEMYTYSTHSLLTVNSLFINSPRCKSCSSLRSVLSTAVPCHSVNKLSGWRRPGCLLLGYKLVAVNEGVWKLLSVLKWGKLLDGACSLNELATCTKPFRTDSLYVFKAMDASLTATAFRVWGNNLL